MATRKQSSSRGRAPAARWSAISRRRTSSTSRDVRATGATNINDLLDALAPQIGSAQGRSGGRPVLLLNGQRIAGFRELRDIPPEAIERLEILPEEVALKYGYRADQKVVNIVLRQRFRSTTAQVGGELATEGGYANGNADLTRFSIQRNGRTTLNAPCRGQFDADRGRAQHPALAAADRARSKSSSPHARCWAPSATLACPATFNRQVLGDVSATLNTELEHSDGRSLIGPRRHALDAARPQDEQRQRACRADAQRRRSRTGAGRVTSNADLERDVTRTDRDSRPARPRARDHGLGRHQGDRERQPFRASGGQCEHDPHGRGSTVHLTAPGGDLASPLQFARPDDGRSGDQPRPADLAPEPRFQRARQPHPERQCRGRSALGLWYADDGRRRANWSPVDRLNLLAAGRARKGRRRSTSSATRCWRRPARAFSISRPGRPCSRPSITGGNPDLQADRRTVTKLSANWQPFEKTDLRFRGEYVHQTIDNPISPSTVTAAIERRFPDRFVRDALRPVDQRRFAAGEFRKLARATRFASGSTFRSRSNRTGRRKR